MGNRFSDQVAWVTGGGSGIGRATALELAAQGAHIVLTGRRVEKLEAVAEEVRAFGRRALVLRADVTDEAALAQAIERIESEFGRLDITVANAGFAVAGRIDKISTADWRRQLDVNVIGVATTVRLALPLLYKSRGRVGIVSSVMSTVQAPNNGAYCASKAAASAIGATLAMELKGTGVSCTTIHPGFVESEIGQVDNEGRFDERVKEKRPKKMMWTGRRAAKVIVKALHRRRTFFVFTAHGKAGMAVFRFLPGLARWALSRGKQQAFNRKAANRLLGAG